MRDKRHDRLVRSSGQHSILVTWIISATGSVAKVAIKETTMNNVRVERCIVAKIKAWKFPRPAGGGTVEVNFPFVFPIQGSR